MVKKLAWEIDGERTRHVTLVLIHTYVQPLFHNKLWNSSGQNLRKIKYWDTQNISQ